MGTDALRLDAIDTCYGDSHVLHGVSFDLPKGKVVALLGRNGAGKTTCISSIIGFLQPRKGRIELFGKDIAGSSPEAISAAGIGLVPQGRRIFPTLTVYENLNVARKTAFGDEWSIEKVYSVFPRLGERARTAAGSLSGGEQQMLAIGRALVGNPRIILLDEPSEGLAPQIVSEVAAVLRQLKESGLTILLVEQNVKLALSLANEVVILNSGQVVFRGPTHKIENDHAYLAQQLGIH